MKHLMRSQTAAEYLDMEEDVFRMSVAAYADSLMIGEEQYYRRADLEHIVKCLFEAPSEAAGNVLPFPP